MKSVFISYSHVDEQYRAELEKHLALLRRQGHITTWSDHRIPPGSELESAISTALESAEIILFLVSSDFLNSEYCYGIEMRRALERHQAGQVKVIPLIVRPCDWTSSPFGRLKALPADGRPVTKWPSLDDAFLDVVQRLRPLLATGDAVQASHRKPTVYPRAEIDVVKPASVIPSRRSSNLALPRRFTDEDKHDFVVNSFKYIRSYFEQSVPELQARNPGITVRLHEVSNMAFTAIVFRDGRRIGGCSVRFGSPYGSNGIAYSASENALNNSYNELLSVENDDHLLFLKATMGRSSGRDVARLTDEGAAEHLWSMFLEPMQR